MEKEKKTYVKREVFGSEVRQREEDGFLSATDLVNAGNKLRAKSGAGEFQFYQWRNCRHIAELISVLEKRLGKVIESGRGRGSSVWVHPCLFVNLALAIDGSFKPWECDWLPDFRSWCDKKDYTLESMIGRLFLNATRRLAFAEDMDALFSDIRNVVGVDNWESATEEQLMYRDKIYDWIGMMCDVFYHNNDAAIKVGLAKAMEWESSIIW